MLLRFCVRTAALRQQDTASYLMFQRCGGANTILRRKAIDLASGRGKCIFDRRLGVFMPSIIERCMADHDAFVRRNCQPDVDLEAGAVAMLVTRGDHLYAAACNALIVCFQPLNFTQYLGTGKFRRFGTFESDLWGYKTLSSSMSVGAGKTRRLYLEQTPSQGIRSRCANPRIVE
jgi:hypothetical protein